MKDVIKNLDLMKLEYSAQDYYTSIQKYVRKSVYIYMLFRQSWYTEMIWWEIYLIWRSESIVDKSIIRMIKYFEFIFIINEVNVIIIYREVGKVS